jgi:antitoxin PrlF
MNKAKLTSKYQTSIPKEIREILGLNKGDSIGFEIIGVDKKEVKLFKLESFDIDYLKSLESSLEEWNSEEDNENFKHLQV